MRYVFFIFLLSACGDELPSWRDHADQLEIYFPHADYEVSDGSPSIPLVASKKLTLAAVRKQIALVKNPDASKIVRKAEAKKIPFELTRKRDGGLRLTPTKPLLRGHYGIYQVDKSHDAMGLRLVFFVKPKPPSIVLHETPTFFPPSSTMFLFEVDQPVVIESDDAVMATAEDNSHLHIHRIQIEQGVQILVQLAPAFEKHPGAQAFLFNHHIKNRFGLGLVPEQRVVSQKSSKKDSYANALVPFGAISSSDGVIEIVWNAAPSSALLFLQTQRDCPQSSCTAFYELPVTKNSTNLWRRSVPVDAQTPYRYVVRAQNYRGEVFVASGLLTTNKKEHLRFSEIMINPKKMVAGSSENSTEYFEVVNLDDNEVSLAGLALHMEDETGVRDCPLNAPHVLLKPAAHALFVSETFEPSAYNLGTNALVIRVMGSSLCGGLSNSRQKIITLHRNDGTFIDRYSGYLWHARDGESVQRIAHTGLDESSNYCYSRHPTPGTINAPCEGV